MPLQRQRLSVSRKGSRHPGLWDGLIGLWVPSFGPSVDVKDHSGRGNHGAIQTGALYDMQPPFGFCIDGDGTDQASVYIDSATGEIDTSQGAMFLWIDADTVGGAAAIYLWDWGDASDSGASSLGFRQVNDNTLRFRYRVSSTNTDVSFGTFATGRQTMCGSWYADGTVTGSHNGVPATSGTRGGDITAGALDTAVIFGKGQSLGAAKGSSPLDGRFGIAILWQRPLLLREAITLHRDPLAMLRQRQRKRGKAPVAAAGVPLGSLALMGVGR